MDDSPNPQDDPLDRVIASLRDVPIPQGPSAKVIDRTLASIRSHEHSGITRVYLTRVAAIVAFGLCLIAVLLVVPRHSRHTVVQESHPAPVPQTPPTSLVVRPDHPAPHPSMVPHDPAPQPIVIASNVSVTGRVIYQGMPVVPRAVDLSNCPQCVDVAHGKIYDDSLLVSPAGMLQNAVVSISAGLPPDESFPPPADPIVLDQKGCMFRPHVVASMVAQNVVVKNSDPLLHIVHSMDAEQTPVFNFAQPTIGQHTVDPIRVVETFRVKCDLHPWMNAWVRVFNHPYFAVTQVDGEFSLNNLPPGNYRIKAWHELLGVQEKDLVVRPGGPAMVDFVFSTAARPD